MELNNLQGFVLMLVMIGMLLGAGILILDKTSESIYDTVTVSDLAITIPAVNTAAAIKGNITSYGYIRNATNDTFSSGNYTVHKANGTIFFDDVSVNLTCKEGQTCYLTTYTYKEYGTVASGVFGNVISATTPVASTWLPLIVTIVILAIILVIVVRSFQARQR